MKTIAIDLDDTLNNFTETLQTAEFRHGAEDVVSKDVFYDYLQRIRSDKEDPSNLLSTDYSFFRGKIVCKCHELAAARQDGVEFMQWLRSGKWRIVICTHSDLRKDGVCIKKWLRDNHIPFDFLFMTWNKLEFCQAWGIEYLVDDHPFHILHGARFGIKVFYPIMAKHRTLEPNGARGFDSFDQVKQWIQN